MKKWNVDQTIDLSHLYKKGEIFRIVFAFTPTGLVKIVGAGSVFRETLKKLPTCHALSVDYYVRIIGTIAGRKETKFKITKWQIVGEESHLHLLQRIAGRFVLVRRFLSTNSNLTRQTQLLSNSNLVLGSWRKMPAVYLKEFQNKAHKRYPYRKVQLCQRCMSILPRRLFKFDKSLLEHERICPKCGRNVVSFTKEVIGNSQVSVPIMVTHEISNYCDYKVDETEERITEKGW